MPTTFPRGFPAFLKIIGANTGQMEARRVMMEARC